MIARRGVWDPAISGWAPDWFGDSAKSFFEPLFDGRTRPPASADSGLFNDPLLNSIIDRALAAATDAASAPLWHAADIETMEEAAVFPIADPNIAIMHESRVHNWIYLPYPDQADPTDVWLEG